MSAASIAMLLGGIILWGGWLVPVAALLLAVQLMMPAGQAAGSAQTIAAAAMILSIPFAAFLCGRALSSFAEGPCSRIVESAIFALSLAVMFGSQIGLEVTEAALTIAVAGDWKECLSRASACIGAALFCGLLTGACVVLAVIALELPLAWLRDAVGASLAIPFAAMRPLLALLALSMCMNLAVSLFIAELGPPALAGIAHRSSAP